MDINLVDYLNEVRDGTAYQRINKAQNEPKDNYEKSKTQKSQEAE